MLHTYLEKNHVSLANNNLQALKISDHQYRKPCCNLLWSKEADPTLQPMQSPPRSLTYKRKKIFQQHGSPELLFTATFKDVDLEESKVEHYAIPVTVKIQEQKSEEIRLVKKKGKNSKENGLHLAKGKIQFRQDQRRSLETIPSTLNEIMPQSNEQIKQSKDMNSSYKTSKKQANDNPDYILFSKCQSLIIVQGEGDFFTFNSEGAISSSLAYSPSKRASTDRNNPIITSFSMSNSTYNIK